MGGGTAYVVTAHYVLEKNIPSDWPISVVDGKIVIPQTFNGHELKDAIRSLVLQNENYWDHETNQLGAPRYTAVEDTNNAIESKPLQVEIDSETLEKRVQSVLTILNSTINKTNTDLESIRQSTEKTVTPTILMATPEDRMNFWDRLCHQTLKSDLEASGARIETPSTFSSIKSGVEVWTRDRYVLGSDGTAFFHRPLNENDVKDYDITAVNQASQAMIKDFQSRGIKTKIIDSHIEGGDVLQHPQSNTVFVGVDVKKGVIDQEDLKSAQNLAANLGLTLKLIPKTQSNGSNSYYHLDTFMSILPTGEVMVIPEATNAEGMANIKSVVSENNLLEIKRTEEEKANNTGNLTLATNIITVNKNVFTPNLRPEMKKFLEDRGYHAYEGSYQVANSGPHCQTNFIKAEKINGKGDISFNDIELPADMRKLQYKADITMSDVTLPSCGSGTSSSISIA